MGRSSTRSSPSLMTRALTLLSPTHDEPSAYASRFQIGTVDLMVSMIQRQASSASPLCGAPAATTTVGSPSSQWPVR